MGHNGVLDEKSAFESENEMGRNYGIRHIGRILVNWDGSRFQVAELGEWKRRDRQFVGEFYQEKSIVCMMEDKRSNPCVFRYISGKVNLKRPRE